MPAHERNRIQSARIFRYRDNRGEALLPVVIQATGEKATGEKGSSRTVFGRARIRIEPP
jgi:hypothetical protein